MSGSAGLRTFRGAVTIVTGGASGIGRAMAEALAHRGASVVLGDLQAELAEEVADGIRARGGQAEAAELDVVDAAAVDQLVQGTLDTHGRLDYLFNNAGIGVGGPVERYEMADWTRVLDVCLHGVVNGVHAAFPRMIEQGFGHLVNTASMAGLTPAAGTTGYCAAKHAVVGLSTSLRIEAEPRGVRVSVLCPGVIRTAILEGGGKYGREVAEIPDELREKMMERLRPMDPDRFAEQALAAVAANKAIIVIPGWWKIWWWMFRLSPGLGIHLSVKMYRRLLAEMEKTDAV